MNAARKVLGENFLLYFKLRNFFIKSFDYWKNIFLAQTNSGITKLGEPVANLQSSTLTLFLGVHINKNIAIWVVPESRGL